MTDPSVTVAKLGRPSIGKEAMTPAERMRRSREHLPPPLHLSGLEPDVIAQRIVEAVPEKAHQIVDALNRRLGSDAVRIEASGAPDNASPNDYPRMLYHSDGRTTIAATSEQHHELAADGWVTAPLAVHRQRPVTHHGFLGDPNHPFAAPMPRW